MSRARRIMGLTSIVLIGMVLGEADRALAQTEGDCGAQKVQRFIGKVSSGALIAQITRLSGAGMVRIIKPGMMITMDYAATRLNVTLDGRRRIIGLRCG